LDLVRAQSVLPSLRSPGCMDRLPQLHPAVRDSFLRLPAPVSDHGDCRIAWRNGGGYLSEMGRHRKRPADDSVQHGCARDLRHVLALVPTRLAAACRARTLTAGRSAIEVSGSWTWHQRGPGGDVADACLHSPQHADVRRDHLLFDGTAARLEWLPGRG